MTTHSLPEEFTIREDFPPVSYQQWRTLVEESLGGAPFDKKLVSRTYDDLAVQPVYSRQDALPGSDPGGFPGLSPFLRGGSLAGAVPQGWDLRQEQLHPDLRQANQAIRDDLSGGARSLLLRLDAAARGGWDADDAAAASLAGANGLMAYSVADLDVLLEGVDPSAVALAWDAGQAFLPAAALLAAWCDRRGAAREQVAVAFNADPLGAWARQGAAPWPVEQSLAAAAALARWSAETYPAATSLAVDTSPYHDAGATAVQDIAFAVATGVEYLRALTSAGMDVDAAARQIAFRMQVGTHHFLAIAKLRAVRAAWARVVEASGGQSASAAMRLHCRIGNRVLTRRDPYVNLLRNTVAVFAAALGGAEVITSAPFDLMAGPPDAFSRRVARNTVLVIQEESHLNRVLDPLGGSWFLDRLTDQLGEAAWSLLQDLERRGGMRPALASGWVAEQVAAAHRRRAADFARRKEGITGVSEFPDVSEAPLRHEPLDLEGLRRDAGRRLAESRGSASAIAKLELTPAGVAALVEAAAGGATLGGMARALGMHAAPGPEIPPLRLRAFAEPFEELRDASDAWLAAQGRRPRAFLANLGPAAQHGPRAGYAKNFFEAGGFEVLGNSGFADAEAVAEAFTASQADIAVICSSDAMYQQAAAPAAARLKQVGARSVVLAGAPGDNEAAWREAGVDRFIFIRCDVLQTLREMLSELGVWTPKEDAKP